MGLERGLDCDDDTYTFPVVVWWSCGMNIVGLAWQKHGMPCDMYCIGYMFERERERERERELCVCMCMCMVVVVMYMRVVAMMKKAHEMKSQKT
jgi:hypothetical protein